MMPMKEEKIKVSDLEENKWSRLTDARGGWFFFLGLLCLCLGIWVNVSFDRIKVVWMNNGHSGAFRGVDTPDPLMRIDDSEAMVITSGEYLFEHVLSDDPHANVAFHYTCEPVCEQLWLAPILKGGEPAIKFLLRHPVMDSLDWFFIEDQQFRLYQRVPKYKTISDYITDKGNDRPLMESTFLDVSGYNEEGLSLLDDTWSLGEETEVITTYKGVNRIGDYFFFGVALPETLFARGEHNEVRWRLYHVSQSGEVPVIKIARIQFGQ